MPTGIIIDVMAVVLGGTDGIQNRHQTVLQTQRPNVSGSLLLRLQATGSTGCCSTPFPSTPEKKTTPCPKTSSPSATAAASREKMWNS